ncbi:low-density lipoprotein receptor-related protein 4-like [Physella acuta]|uniref:low-density lipoprotein receptor-related protein 4-like n=1 Tax=Physella acuta TaxID=109671 RepID=UPI0027DB948C|nr:low-density lipoprotein receptor-related protein 4-like [Physella acuta]
MNFGLFILVLFGDALASSDQKLLLNCNQTYVYDAFGNPVYQELQTKPVCSIKETSIICSQNPRTGTDSSIVEKVNEQSNITCMAQDEVDGTIYYYTNRTYKYLNSGGSSGDLENISELQDPEDMTVDAYQKILFISLKTHSPKIVKYNILMKNWSVVTDENIKWPKSLAHDHENRKVFWVDAKLRRINNCSYDGHCETVLKNHQNLSSPSSLAIENNTLYWLDTDLSEVLSCQADHCNDTFKKLFSVDKTCKELKILHEGIEDLHRLHNSEMG